MVYSNNYCNLGDKMNTINIIANDCEHCAYCAKHYFNIGGTFRYANCMHCINTNMYAREKASRIKDKVKCEYWQPEQIQIDKRRNNIEMLLTDIAQKLQDVTQILKEDNKK